MELSYSYLYNQKVSLSLRKLFKTPLHGAILSNVVKFRKNWMKHFDTLRLEYMELVKKYAEVDEKGNLVQPDEEGSFKIREGQSEAWEKALTEFMAKTVVLKDMRKFDFQYLVNNGVELSAEDVELLEPILDGVEDSQ